MATPSGVGRVELGIVPEMLLPDLLSAHPEARVVFDRHGLRGCGGPLGPHESIRYFARVHGVDETVLLHELEESIRLVPVETTQAEPAVSHVADSLYRRFFIGGIAVTLTAGATWGAWLLWTIALAARSGRSPSPASTRTARPRSSAGWGSSSWGSPTRRFPGSGRPTWSHPALAAWNFWLMIAGIVLRTDRHDGRGSLVAGARPWPRPAALLELASVLIFVSQMVITFRRSVATIEPYVGVHDRRAGLVHRVRRDERLAYLEHDDRVRREVPDLGDRNLPVPAPRSTDPRPGPFHDPGRVLEDDPPDVRRTRDARSPCVVGIRAAAAGGAGRGGAVPGLPHDGKPPARDGPSPALAGDDRGGGPDRRSLEALAADPRARPGLQVRPGLLRLALHRALHVTVDPCLPGHGGVSPPRRHEVQPRLPGRHASRHHGGVRLADDHGDGGEGRADVERGRSATALRACGARSCWSAPAAACGSCSRS